MVFRGIANNAPGPHSNSTSCPAKFLTVVFPWPEFAVGGAFGKFEDGQLIDEKTGEYLDRYVAGFAETIRRWGPSRLS